MSGSHVPSHDEGPAGDQATANAERPFTDYGQFGIDMIDTRVLWQDQVWVDRLGTPHALHEMSDLYVTNVIDYLHRRAPGWLLDAVLAAMTDLAHALAEEAQREALLPLLEQLEALRALDPVEWIDQTPLIRALRSRTDPSNS